MAPEMMEMPGASMEGQLWHLAVNHLSLPAPPPMILTFNTSIPVLLGTTCPSLWHQGGGPKLAFSLGGRVKQVFTLLGDPFHPSTSSSTSLTPSPAMLPVGL